MRGFPKRLATKQDVINCMGLFPQQTAQTLRQLLESRFVWQHTAELSDTDEGVTDETHCVRVEDVTDTDKDGNPSSRKVRYQCERVESPKAELFRIGLTVEEAERMAG